MNKIELSNLFEKKNIFSSIIYSIFQIILKLIRLYFKRNSAKTGNITIIALHKLGDSVYTIPTIQEIEKIFNQNLNIFCYSETLPIFQLKLQNPKYHILKKSDFKFGNRIAPDYARKKLREIQSEIVIDLTGVMNSASLIFNSNAKKIVGINRRIFKSLYDEFYAATYTSHISDMYYNVLKSWKITHNLIDEKPFQKKTNKIDKILIHPFAGWKSKEWKLINFIKLAVEIKERSFIPQFILPKEHLSYDVLSELDNLEIDYIISESVDSLIETIRNSTLLVGNDSGPIHIANLLEIPTFTIYGPTNPKVHLPLNGINGFCNLSIRCSPKNLEKWCFTDGGINGCPSYECMEGLSVNFVVKELFNFIHKIKSN
ncbi:MAG TPA: glycosyltransferase family 9 protein [Ignavibacteriaceae bacterium]|nr:glycosyltransferase family 9 protein [Ignavibacteriaceae bacterium]